jgi:rubrerythrin
MSDGILQNAYPVPPLLLYELAKYSDVLRTVMNSLRGEIFRNGVEVVSKFMYKCDKCGMEYQDEKDKDGKCDDCGGPLREPEPTERLKLMNLLEGNINVNNQRLIDVCYQAEDDLNIMDDMYILLSKEYEVDGNGEPASATVKEIVRLNPVQMRIVANKNGEPGKDDDGNTLKTCLIHRSVKTKNGDACPKCKGPTFPIEYAAIATAAGATGFSEIGDHIYYIQGEVFHISKYQPSLTYGWPPTITVWQKATTLVNMDRYMKDWWKEGRPPNSLLLVNTNNPTTLQKAWQTLKDHLKKEPNMIYPLAVESSSNRGQVAQMLKLIDGLEEMQYIEVRNEIRKMIGAVYGVMPLFMADISASGGLNNEGLQITVTNRAVSRGQAVWNDKFFAWISEQYMVKDWLIKLKPSEEQDEMHDLQLEAQRINNALAMKSMGFDVKREENGEFTYEKMEGQQNPEGQPGMGMGPNAPKVPGVPGVSEGGGGFQGRGINGEPEDVRRAFEISKILESEGFVVMKDADTFEMRDDGADAEMLRSSITAELSAVSLYESMADKVQDSQLQEIFQNIAREEKVHIGEFQRMLDERDKEQAKASKEGAAEADKLTKAFADVMTALAEIEGDNVYKAGIDPALIALIEKAVFTKRFEGLAWRDSQRVKELLIRAFKNRTPMSELMKQIMSVNKKITENDAERIVRTEDNAIKNVSREYSYKKMDPDEEKLYKWVGPDDQRTTDICRKIVQRVGDGKHMDDLKKIVEEEAVRGGFKPREWTAHINCRHMLVRTA